MGWLGGLVLWCVTDELVRAERGKQRRTEVNGGRRRALTLRWLSDECSTFGQPLRLTIRSLGRRTLFAISLVLLSSIKTYLPKEAPLDKRRMTSAESPL